MIASNIFQIELSDQPEIVSLGKTVFEGPSVHSFNMRDVWCIHLYEYEADFILNGIHFHLSPGTLTITPPFAHVQYHFTDKTNSHLYMHFEAGISRNYQIPCQIDHVSNFYYDRFHDAIRLHSFNRVHSNLKLWDMLFALSEQDVDNSEQAQQKTPLPVRKAINHMELNLQSSISLIDLRSVTRTSASHLNRLFKLYTGMSPIQYLNRKRMLQAKHLLLNTNQPIKDIAYQIGMSDLQHFNKSIRREFGIGPRAVRERGLV